MYRIYSTWRKTCVNRTLTTNSDKEKHWNKGNISHNYNPTICFENKNPEHNIVKIETWIYFKYFHSLEEYVNNTYMVAKYMKENTLYIDITQPIGL